MMVNCFFVFSRDSQSCLLRLSCWSTEHNCGCGSIDATIESIPTEQIAVTAMSANVVSPPPKTNMSGTKRLCMFKDPSSITPKSCLTNPVEAYIVSMRGGIDLMYFDQGDDEGFMFPLMELLFPTPGKKKPNNDVILKRATVFKATGIVSAVFRRISLDNNEAMLKESNFKKVYFVRYDGAQSTTVARKQALQAAVDYLNFAKGKDSKTQYIVPQDYDKTPHQKERWDERILDKDIAKLMRMLLDPIPDNTFFEEHREMADNFYTLPYPEIAHVKFGYKDNVV